jgi:hypothetical protein
LNWLSRQMVAILKHCELAGGGMFEVHPNDVNSGLQHAAGVQALVPVPVMPCRLSAYDARYCTAVGLSAVRCSCTAS